MRIVDARKAGKNRPYVGLEVAESKRARPRRDRWGPGAEAQIGKKPPKKKKPSGMQGFIDLVSNPFAAIWGNTIFGKKK